MIFWLVLKLEITYRVLMSWSILVSFRGLFEDYSFAWWNILSFHNSSFALRYFLWCKWQDHGVRHLLFCFVYCIKISQTMVLFHAMLLLSLESSQWGVGVHQLGLRLFGATMWKLLIIEPFSQQWSNKIETENCIRKPWVSHI